MNLGLGINIGGSARSAPTSLYTTANFTALGPTDHRTILSADSFRVARTGAGVGRFDITGVPSGTYRVRGVLADWGGAAIGITTRQIRVMDNNTQRAVITAAGAFDSGPVTISSGILSFFNGANGLGGDVTSLFIERIS